MGVCCECCVLSGRGLCDELITRPEESYRLWCVVVCDLETSRMRRSWPALGCSATGKIYIYMYIHLYLNILYYLWSVLLYHILGEKVTEQKPRVFKYLCKYWDISHSKENWTRYDIKKYDGLHIKYPLFLADDNKPRIFPACFRKTLKNEISWKSV